MTNSTQLQSVNPILRNINFEIKPRPLKNLIMGIALIISIAPTLLISLIILWLAGTCFKPLILIGTIILIIRMIRLALRYLHNPLQHLKDSRPPVLFLRSFFSQMEEDPNRVDRRSPEELLAKVLKQVGPVIAVGKPNEKGLPFLGATRIYFTKNWKMNIVKLMSVSKLIVIDVDDTQSVLWEINNARKIVSPSQILLSFFSKQESGGIEAFYKRFSKNFEEIFPTKLPPYQPNVYLICFDPNWNPYTITFETRKPHYNFYIPILYPSKQENYVRWEQISGVLIPYFRSNGLM